jgi:hypothetical protein
VVKAARSKTEGTAILLASLLAGVAPMGCLSFGVPTATGRPEDPGQRRLDPGEL